MSLDMTPVPKYNDVIIQKQCLPTEKQAYNFSTLVKEASIELGFTSFKVSLIVLAVSEITINAIHHAKGASAELKKQGMAKALA